MMTDDVGFGASSTFGGPVATPNLDRLAAMGARYNRFHTTAICSPSRAALLTGRNAHAAGTGSLPELGNGFPGYVGQISRQTATVARILRDNGYSTAMFGKHHNLPMAEASAAGPFTNWPTGLGFDYFYGFIEGDSHQFNPRLYRGTQPLDDARPEAGEALDHALVSDAIKWIHNQKAGAPDKPFLIYLAPGSMHAPHHAPQAYVQRYRGKFDSGWDMMRQATLARQKRTGIVPSSSVLTPRPEEIPAWSSLAPEQQRIQAREMEAAAAALSYQDAQFGRLLDELQRMGQLENTLVIFVEGDNGGSAENGPTGSLNELGWIVNRIPDDEMVSLAMLDEIGGPETYSNYSVGWAWAMNTPFQWNKQIASHLGGIRNGLVIAWQGHIDQPGKVRSQFAHLNDIVPTILEASGITAPQTVDGIVQKKMDGTSLAYTFRNPSASEAHTVQYFEQVGNRGIYANGWFANTRPLRMPWNQVDARPTDVEKDYTWELYDLTKDYSQSKDLAARFPDKLTEMKRLFDAEARANNVYPLDDRRGPARTAALIMRNPPRADYVYWGKDISVLGAGAPNFVVRNFSVQAEISVPTGHETGVIAANGSRFGGWSFYLKDGRPTAFHAFSHELAHKFRVTSSTPLAPGKHLVTFDFRFDASRPFSGGTMTISADGSKLAVGRIERTVLRPAGNGETFDIGRDTGSSVTDDYVGQGNFAGAIDKVAIHFEAPTGEQNMQGATAKRPGLAAEATPSSSEDRNLTNREGKQ
ncbi:MAG: arylsulfatase [Novosphingobium sp.]|nr:arylsulfatase [Novosphingobium sp.]